MSSQNRVGRSPFFCLSLAMTRPWVLSHFFVAHSGEQLVNPSFSRSPVICSPQTSQSSKEHVLCTMQGSYTYSFFSVSRPLKVVAGTGISIPQIIFVTQSFMEQPLNNCSVSRVKVPLAEAFGLTLHGGSSFPVLLRPCLQDIQITHQRRPAPGLCPGQHPVLDKIIFAENS